MHLYSIVTFPTLACLFHSKDDWLLVLSSLRTLCLGASSILGLDWEPIVEAKGPFISN